MLYGDWNLGLLVGYHDLFWYCLIKTQFLDETITVNPYVIWSVFTLSIRSLKLYTLSTWGYFCNIPLPFAVRKTHFWAKTNITRIKKLRFFITHELQWEQIGGTTYQSNGSMKLFLITISTISQQLKILNQFYKNPFIIPKLNSQSNTRKPSGKFTQTQH